MNLNDIRQEYLQNELSIKDLDKSPFEQFKKWFQNALDADIDYVNAASLATIGRDGFPSNRIVLLKDINDTGIHIYTDYRSQKALDIEFNPNICLNIFWKEFDRQIRMTGTASKLNREENIKYFQSRPKASQISATASYQSSIASKIQLEEDVKQLTIKYKDEEKLPCPDYWGGYLVTISKFEFWQGRPSRLHDRFQYCLENNKWKIDRLAP